MFILYAVFACCFVLFLLLYAFCIHIMDGGMENLANSNWIKTKTLRTHKHINTGVRLYTSSVCVCERVYYIYFIMDETFTTAQTGRSNLCFVLLCFDALFWFNENIFECFDMKESIKHTHTHTQRSIDTEPENCAQKIVSFHSISLYLSLCTLVMVLY